MMVASLSPLLLLSIPHSFATTHNLHIMFKKFDPSFDVSTSTQVKASVQRAVKTQLLESHPNLTEDVLDALLPRKSHMVQYKVGSHLMLYCRRHEHEDRSPTDEPVLFQHRDGPVLPTLKLVHQYPTLEFTRVTVDRGAIPFLLGGANVMCPGLTNPGGEMPDDTDERPGLEKGAGVVIYAEGKEYALGVGVMTLSSVDVYVQVEWMVDSCTAGRSQYNSLSHTLASQTNKEQRHRHRAHTLPRRWIVPIG